MAKTATFYIDKFDNSVTLHRHDRTSANRLAEGLGESIGKFIAMLVNEIENMPDNSTISITVNKE